MPNVKFRKGTKAYNELTDGLPKSFMITIDWDDASAKCEANRRNCAIHNALSKRNDLTLPSAGVDEINFVWRGDARLAVAPNGSLMKVIAKNDLAAAGEIPWPTGKETIRLDLEDVRIKKDLRRQRANEREKRQRDPEKVNATKKASRDRINALDYAGRAAKRVETERTRGRFV